MTRAKEIAVLGALIAVLYFALTYGLYSTVTSRVLGANDFYSRWEGARALFLRGENPYSDAVTREIQFGMYGRLARPDEDQVAFAYPLYAAFVAAPLVTLSYAQAQAFWTAFLILAVAGGTLGLTHACRIVRPAPIALMLLLALVLYPSVRAIFNGQYAIVSFFCIALAIALTSSHHDVVAGMFLALATMKPQPAIFLVPAILVWATRQRRWKIALYFALMLSALVVAALVLVPTWLFDFVEGLRRYTEYEPIGPPLEIVIGSLVADVGWRAGLTAAGVLALVGWMGWRVSRTMNASWENFLPTLGLIAILTTVWAGRVGSSDQVLLLIPWVAWLSDWIARKEIGLAIFAALVIMILPWVVFFATLRGNAENIGVSLILSFLSLVVYVWRGNSSSHPNSQAEGVNSLPLKGNGQGEVSGLRR